MAETFFTILYGSLAIIRVPVVISGVCVSGGTQTEVL
jgi:hypothetical protein